MCVHVCICICFYDESRKRQHTEPNTTRVSSESDSRDRDMTFSKYGNVFELYFTNVKRFPLAYLGTFPFPNSFVFASFLSF